MGEFEPSGWLVPKAVERLTGDERFSGTNLTVLDFWRWGFSDLRTNIVRGVLAEFLVASAVADPSPLRKAWDNFDVTTPSGIRVEVKSSGYLQSWKQRRVSAIGFSGLTGLPWSDETALYGDKRELRADVYVFAIHMCRQPDQYDALDLSCWDFRVLGVAALRDHGHRSLTKRLLDQLAPTSFRLDELVGAIEDAFYAQSEARGV
jgi:hypothetical protein